MNLHSNIWKFYLFYALQGFTLFTPIIVLFWQENGLSMTEIMILQSLFSLAIVILEVPTGYFADVYGRKRSMVAAGFFLAFGCLFYAFGSNFITFLIAELTWAFGLSLMSGADAALVYDSLKEQKQEKRFKEVWGNAIFYNLLGMGIGDVIGGLLATKGLRLPFYGTAFVMFFLIPISFSFKEPKYHRLSGKNKFNEILTISKHVLFHHKKLRWLILYGGILSGFNSAVLWLYQPYFKLTGLDIVYFGIVFASFQVFAGIVSKYAGDIERIIGKKRSLLLLIIITGMSYLLMSRVLFLFSFLFAFFQQFVRGYSKVIISDYVNDLTKSKMRATVLSVNNLIGRLCYALIIPFIGYIADIYSLVQALAILGFTTVGIGGILVFAMHRANVV